METIKEKAKNYIPEVGKTIADLPEVSVDCEIYDDGEGIDKSGKKFKYSYLLLNAIEYRVPVSVMGQLKECLKEFPDMTTFKVKKSGEGKSSEYKLYRIK